MGNVEEHINNFYKKYWNCKNCNINRGVKRCYDNKYRISNQQKYIMKKIKINVCRNKMIAKTKETQILKT